MITRARLCGICSRNDKYEASRGGHQWHRIGHLQTNKVKMVVPFRGDDPFARQRSAGQAIQKAAAAAGRTIDVLLEIHVADEESKSGWEWAELQGIRSQRRLCYGCPTCGCGDCHGRGDQHRRRKQVIRRDFAALQRYKSELSPYFGPEFDTLSIGMSHDYRIALGIRSDAGAYPVR